MKHPTCMTLTLTATVLWGCASQTLDCSGRETDCEEVFAACEPVPEACRRLPPGASYALVEIESSPTPAAIHVDGEYVGNTPLRHPLSFTSQTRYVTVVAEPLYPSQTRQERRLRIPPLPNRIQFFMNNPQREEQASEGRL